jgi:hypothetical protein
MQVWLLPIEFVIDVVPPIVTILARIDQCMDGYPRLASNYPDWTGEWVRICGKSKSGREIGRSELISAFRDMALFFYPDGDPAERVAYGGVDWCLPFIDYDLHFAEHDRFIADILNVKFPGLRCYLCVGNTDNPIARRWRDVSEVSVINDKLLKVICPHLGFPNIPDLLEDRQRHWQRVRQAELALPEPQKSDILSLPRYRNIDDV